MITIKKDIKVIIIISKLDHIELHNTYKAEKSHKILNYISFVQSSVTMNLVSE